VPGPLPVLPLEWVETGCVLETGVLVTAGAGAGALETGAAAAGAAGGDGEGGAAELAPLAATWPDGPGCGRTWIVLWTTRVWTFGRVWAAAGVLIGAAVVAWLLVLTA
jgi:hypothetical protein